MGQKGKGGGELMSERLHFRITPELREEIEEYRNSLTELRGEELQVAIRALIKTGLRIAHEQKRESRIAEDTGTDPPRGKGD